MNDFYIWQETAYYYWSYKTTDNDFEDQQLL